MTSNNTNNSGLKTIDGNFGTCLACSTPLKKVELSTEEGCSSTTEEIWDQACPCSYMGCCEWLMLENLVDNTTSKKKTYPAYPENMDAATAATNRGELVLLCETCNLVVVPPKISNTTDYIDDDDATDAAITDASITKDWRTSSDISSKKKRRKFKLFGRKGKNREANDGDAIQASRSN